MGWEDKGPAAIYRTPEHRAARAALVQAHEPGDPCCLCGHPMWDEVRYLHADHEPGTDQYRGLAHGTKPCQDCGIKCNVVDGARRGRARQEVTDLDW